MTLAEFKELLSQNSQKRFQVTLPDGSAVPLSFHITEVGRVQKTFLDCGGTLREQVTCQLQIWVGEDIDHRIETGKMASILEVAKAYLPDESVPVEIEYEKDVISQYAVDGAEVSSDRVLLKLAHKHTECLAPELCGLPALPSGAGVGQSDECCSGSGCC